MSGPVVFTPPFKQLVDGVAAYFAANGVTAVVARGWKVRYEQINQGPGRANRVVFLPAKPGGGGGRIVKPREPGERELGADPTTDPPTPAQFTFRPLADNLRTVFVSMWAYDGDHKNDEGAQDDAVQSLFTWTIRAVNSVAFGNADFGAWQFTESLERAFGLEILAELTFQHAMPDLPEDLAYPNAVVSLE